MRVIILYAAMHGFDHGLPTVVKIINETFVELGVEIEEHNLALVKIPYYDGIKSKYTEEMVQGMKKADGIVFATTAQLFAPCAPMQTFLEHLELAEYKTTLIGKNCFLVAVSGTTGEKSALDYLTKVVNYLGGNDAARIGIGGKNQKLIGKSDQLKEIIEKQVEDYYRIIRQNRKFLIPQDSSEGTFVVDNFTPEEYETILKVDKRPKVTSEELYKKINLDKFTQKQEQDINEITQFFAQRYSSQPEIDDASKIIAPTLNKFGNQPIVSRAKSCKQMTQSLPHYFQPHLAGGVSMIIQLNISGNDSFDGYLTIENNDCTYNDGINPKPDITLLTDDKIWIDILNGKHTTQKAFMIGQLKVRGNFVLLPKFEQLFKKM